MVVSPFAAGPARALWRASGGRMSGSLRSALGRPARCGARAAGPADSPRPRTLFHGWPAGANRPRGSRAAPHARGGHPPARLPAPRGNRWRGTRFRTACASSPPGESNWWCHLSSHRARWA